MKKKPKTANEVKFLNGKDNKDELYVEWYLQELKDVGIIQEFWYHPEVYNLTNPVMKIEKGFKGRGSNKQEIDIVKSFKRGHTFKPEFRIKWSTPIPAKKFLKPYQFISESNIITTGVGYFFSNMSLMSDIDVKPKFQIHEAAQAKFSLIQSIVLNQYKVFVQPVIYQDLFSKTFTPARYLLTDSGSMSRKISGWKPVTLQEFLINSDSQKEDF